MIALILFMQLNLAILERQANESIEASKKFTTMEMDIWGRNRLRAESNVVIWLLGELEYKQSELDLCKNIQKRVRREP